MPAIKTELRVVEVESLTIGGNFKYGALIDARIQSALESYQNISSISLEFSPEDWRALEDAQQARDWKK